MTTCPDKAKMSRNLTTVSKRRGIDQLLWKGPGPDLQNILGFIINYLKFVVRWTYDSDLRRGKISFWNIVSKFMNTLSDNLTILRVNRT